VSTVEYTSWAMPPSNVGSAAAVQQLQQAFGRGKWDKPIQIAALLDGLIAYTEDLIVIWEKEEPAIAWLSDPSGQWKRIRKELYEARSIFRYWRNEIGRVTQIENPEAVERTITDPLLYGNWTYYEETGRPYPPGTDKNTLPVAGLPWRAGVQMDVVIQHNAEVAEKFVTEILPESVEEGLANVGKGVSSAAAAATDTATQAAGGLFTALWKSTPVPMKVGGFILLYLALAQSGIVPSPRKLMKGGE